MQLTCIVNRQFDMGRSNLEQPCQGSRNIYQWWITVVKPLTFQQLWRNFNSTKLVAFRNILIHAMLRLKMPLYEVWFNLIWIRSSLRYRCFSNNALLINVRLTGNSAKWIPCFWTSRNDLLLNSIVSNRCIPVSKLQIMDGRHALNTGSWMIR